MAQKKLTSFFTLNVSRSADSQTTIVPSGNDEDHDVHDHSQNLLSETDVEPQVETDHVEPQVEPQEIQLESPCECPCCTNVAVPYHPLHLSESRTSHCSQRQGTLISYSRRIQPGWYAKYPWISVCTTKYKIFCSICRHA